MSKSQNSMWKYSTFSILKTVDRKGKISFHSEFFFTDFWLKNTHLSNVKSHCGRRDMLFALKTVDMIEKSPLLVVTSFHYEYISVASSDPVWEIERTEVWIRFTVVKKSKYRFEIVAMKNKIINKLKESRKICQKSKVIVDMYSVCPTLYFYLYELLFGSHLKIVKMRNLPRPSYFDFQCRLLTNLLKKVKKIFIDATFHNELLFFHWLLTNLLLQE